MDTMTTANAIYTNADETVDLVVLDDADSVLEIVAEGLTEEQVDAIYAGETEYRVVGHDVEIGDGDHFQRLELRTATRTDTATTALQQAHSLLAQAWSALEMGSGDDPEEPASNALIEARAAVNAAMRHLDATTTGDESRRIETAAERSTMRQEQADHDRDALHEMIRQSDLGPRRLAELAGLSPQRIAQIKRGTRTW